MKLIKSISELIKSRFWFCIFWFCILVMGGLILFPLIKIWEWLSDE